MPSPNIWRSLREERGDGHLSWIVLLVGMGLNSSGVMDNNSFKFFQEIPPFFEVQQRRPTYSVSAYHTCLVMPFKQFSEVGHASPL